MPTTARKCARSQPGSAALPLQKNRHSTVPTLPQGLTAKQKAHGATAYLQLSPHSPSVGRGGAGSPQMPFRKHPHSGAHSGSSQDLAVSLDGAGARLGWREGPWLNPGDQEWMICRAPLMFKTGLAETKPPREGLRYHCP